MMSDSIEPHLLAQLEDYGHMQHSVEENLNFMDYTQMENQIHMYYQ